MENVIEKVVKVVKQWSWALLGDLAILTDKKGNEHPFNMTDITDPETRRLIFYYGYKQFITDHFSSEKDEDTKILSMREFHDSIIANGLEIAGKGQVVVKGKERANRKVDTWESETLPLLSTYDDDDLNLMIKADKMGLRKLSATFKTTVETEIAKRKAEKENPTE